ncbi:amino acid ABC transporter permease [Clostridia bacterium]|nr:amino acid ABC transporter permease [Clostridia bacterium]
MSMDFSFLSSPQGVAIVTQLTAGMVETLKIFALTLLFALPLGLLVAFGRMSRFLVVRAVVGFYVSIMRGTPLMLQLMLIFFGPYYIFGLSLSTEFRFFAVIIGFSLNYAAYFAEIYRSGIQSMPTGQYEAASVLGFSKSQNFFRIILPQVIKRIMPPMTNETITLVKDTSLAMVLAHQEMFTAAKNLASSQSSVMPFVAAGVFYFVMNYLVAFLMMSAEKRLNYYR